MIHLALFLPLLGGLILLVWPQLGRGWALGVALLTFLLILALAITYPGGMADQTQIPLLPGAGVNYAVGLDGAGLFLWFAVGLVSLLGIWIAQVPPRFLALALCMETGLLGIFATTDLVLFYLFFEATLIPSLFMLGLYGGAERVRALLTFALFTLAGSLPMLASILALRFLSGSPSFLLSDLAQHPLGGVAGTWVFLGFLLAMAVKTPLVPLHPWLPLFHAENHPSGLADAMGTLYKVGIFGLFRWVLPLLPGPFMAFRGFLLFLAALTALYGAWVAFAAKDWKRLWAYGSLSHMGLAALGLFSGTEIGAVGAIFLLGASMIYTGGLFLFSGRLAERTGTLEIGGVRGLARSMPALAALGLILTMAMIGLPGLSGFPGEFMSLLGAYQASPWWTFVGFLSVIAAAAYALTAYQKVFQEKTLSLPAGLRLLDLSGQEWVFGALLVVAVLLLGLYPKLFTELLDPVARSFVHLIQGGL